MSAKSPEPAAIDRRTFLGTVGAAAGALVAASVVPLIRRPDTSLEPPERADGAEESWHVDDMWGHRPRYAHPIPYGPARTSPVLWERVEPIDYMLVI
jgi:hypothetical protein